MTKSGIFTTILLCCLSIAFSNCNTNLKSASQSSLVQDFLTRFNKEKFLEDFETERNRYEKLAQVVKSNGINNQDIRDKYKDTQEAFNKVLSDMTSDINGVRSIVGFKIIDNEARYRNALEDAKIIGGKFNTAVYEIKDLDGKLPYSVNITSFAKMVIWPLISKVHDRYLVKCQTEMNAKLDSMRFRDWDSL